MQLQDLLNAVRTIADDSLAEEWDRVGLHAGHPAQDVERALLCIDLTEAVVQEAISNHAQLIIAYHPPIFAPLKTLAELQWKQRALLAAVRHNIAIYSPHTALDAAEGGVNDFLARGVGAGKVRPIRPAQPGGQKQAKLVVFVPHENADALRKALSEAGAGVIGDYTQCTFGSPGQGTFLGGESTNPTIGEKGNLERVDELRMETVCPVSKIPAVVEALKAAHPYEEPAFDLVPLLAGPQAPGVGPGRVVELDQPITLDELVARLKAQLKVKTLEVARPTTERPIRSVGLCAGAGGSFLGEAGPVDAFFTGEMRHHDVLDARERGQTIILAGHTQTERPFLPTYRDMLANATGSAIDWRVSDADRAPSAIE